MNKWQRILIIALVAQLALMAFVFWPRPAASSGGEPLLGGLETGNVTAMTITDDKGVKTELVKQGEAWVAASAAGYPADAAKITPVLDKLLAIKAGKPVATTPASHAQLEVADDKFLRKIDLVAAGAAAQTVYLGSQAGGQSVHARLGGKNEVYVASGLDTLEANADVLSWIDPVYLSVNSADITGLTLTNQNGEFAMTKDAQGQWQLAGLEAGETLDANKAASLVTAAAAVRMTKPLGKTEDPAWGLQQPSAAVTLQYKSGDQAKTTTLTIGSQDPADKSYAAKSSDSEYFVRVADFAVEPLVTRDRAGFLAATPTPAATLAPTLGATPTP